MARPKPPVEKRSDLEAEVVALLAVEFNDPHDRVRFLCGYFTGVDLVLIKQGLMARAERKGNG